MSAFGLYVILKLDAIGCLLTFAASVCGLALVISIIGSLVTGGDESCEFHYGKFRVVRSYALPMFIVLMPLSVMAPSTNQAAAIYLVPKLANNEQLQELGGKSLSTLTVLVDSWAAELAPRDKETKK